MQVRESKCLSGDRSQKAFAVFEYVLAFSTGAATFVPQ
jgi:hypothetical protein